MKVFPGILIWYFLITQFYLHVIEVCNVYWYGRKSFDYGAVIWLIDCMGTVQFKVHQIFLLKSLTVYVQNDFEILADFFCLPRMQYLYMAFRMETLGYYKNVVEPKDKFSIYL